MKVRGHKRRWKHISNWIEANKNLNLNNLRARQRGYLKIQVHPWGGIYSAFHLIPEPNGKAKAQILEGLIEIYDSWKIELDKLQESYYLKIWLFEPRFSNSQVVCAIGDSLEFYENTFFKPEYSKELSPQNYGRLDKEVSKFNWQYRLDEDHFDENEIGTPEDFTSLKAYQENKKRFNKIMKKPHRTTKYSEPIGIATESYSFKKGDVWLGEK